MQIWDNYISQIHGMMRSAVSYTESGIERIVLFTQGCSIKISFAWLVLTLSEQFLLRNLIITGGSQHLACFRSMLSEPIIPFGREQLAGNLQSPCSFEGLEKGGRWSQRKGETLKAHHPHPHLPPLSPHPYTSPQTYAIACCLLHILC